jgi:hypothetical protein
MRQAKSLGLFGALTVGLCVLALIDRRFQRLCLTALCKLGQ